MGFYEQFGDAYRDAKKIQTTVRDETDKKTEERLNELVEQTRQTLKKMINEALNTKNITCTSNIDTFIVYVGICKPDEESMYGNYFAYVKECGKDPAFIIDVSDDTLRRVNINTIHSKISEILTLENVYVAEKIQYEYALCIGTKIYKHNNYFKCEVNFRKIHD